ncbi:MAG: hypothetical protein OEM40_08670, partial [Acidimicrobiia bacterium]|nr:hypothetical protein [Acidimicrobiia bacterium]
DGLHTITADDKLAACNAYIDAGANFSKTSPAYPISYRLRYLTDFAVASSTLSTTFTERRCVKLTGEFTCRVTGITYKSGTEGKQELFGDIKVHFFDSTQSTSPVHSRTVWSKKWNQFVRVARGKTITLNEDVTYNYPNWRRPFTDEPEVCDTAFVRISGKIFDLAFIPPFMIPRPQLIEKFSKDIPLRDGMGTDTVYLEKISTKIEIGYEINPVYR